MKVPAIPESSRDGDTEDPRIGPSGPAAPFFITGNDRSGTTLLRLILDRGAQAAIPTESMYLMDFAPIRLGRRDLSSHAEAEAFARTVWNHPKVRLWNLEGPAPLPPKGLSHAEAYRFAVEAPYRAFAKRDGKGRFGDKTPAYLDHIKELLTVWPGAKVVILVRDGRDVCLSISPLPFGANNPWAAARDWAAGIRAGVRAQREHPSNVHIIQYERLVASPREEVVQVCDFLGLEFVEDMLAVERAPQGKLVADQAEWFTNLRAGINESSVGKWRTRMSSEALRVFESEAAAELALFGYECAARGQDPASISGIRKLGYRVEDLALRLRNFVKLRLIQERGRELGYVLRRKLGLL